VAHVLGWVAATVIGPMAECKLREKLDSAESWLCVEPFGLREAGSGRLVWKLRVWR